MSDSKKITVKIKRSANSQDSLRESDLIGSSFVAVLACSAVQETALKDYIKEIQLGTVTTSVETAIDAL